MRMLGILLLVGALAGCSILPKPEELNRHTLAVDEAAAVASAGRTQGVLRVAKPTAVAALQTDRLILIKDGVLTYYAGEGWEASIAEMVQGRLLAGLPTRLGNVAVVAGASGVQADRELQIGLGRFETVQNSGEPPRVVIEAQLALVDGTTRRVLRHQDFRFNQPLAQLRLADTLAAYQQGWGQLQQACADLAR